MLRSLNLRGQAIDVDGKIIHIDADGLVSDADSDTEEVLLAQPQNWVVADKDTVTVVPSTPDASGTIQSPTTPVKRGRPSKGRDREFEALSK